MKKQHSNRHTSIQLSAADPAHHASRFTIHASRFTHSSPPSATAAAAPVRPTAPSSSGASTKHHQPKLSSVDLQFLENPKFSRAEICAAFGVPEEIVTSTDHNKCDVMQGARLNFIENRIAPLCARLEAEEQRTVQAIDPSAVGWFDLDSLPIMQQARRNRLAAAKIGFDLGVPFNELNRVLDLGFKPLPWGDTGYLPAALHSLGTLIPPTSANGVPATSPPAADTAPESTPLSATAVPDLLSTIEKLEKILAANAAAKTTAISPLPQPRTNRRLHDSPEGV